MGSYFTELTPAMFSPRRCIESAIQLSNVWCALLQIIEGQDVAKNLIMIFVVGKNHEVEDALYILMVVV